MAEALWVEKYRPKTVRECILPKVLMDTFSDIVEKGEIPNMLLSGSAGLGKTTIARALCSELNLDHILINSSEDSGIEVLRTRIRRFASTVSLSGNDAIKVVILDEADYLNAGSTQVALRGFIEEFSANCRFIFTCNFKNRIIEAIHSRCTCIEFNTSRKDMAKLCGGFHQRVSDILQENNVVFDPKILAELVMRHAPDWRRVINECQRFAISGELSMDAITGTSSDSIAQLMRFLAKKDFKEVRKWVSTNPDIDTATLFRLVFDHSADHVQAKSIPSLVLILADYMYKDSFAADKELNALACMVEMMGSLEFTNV